MLLELSGFTFAHDPTIVKEKDTYYKFCTGFGIPICTSKDLHSWSFTGRSVFSISPKWIKDKVPKCRKLDFWAPEVVKRNGMWRIYYSVSTFGNNRSAIGLAQNKTLDHSSKEYKWQDLGIVIDSTPTRNYNAIDAAVCANEQGDDFLLFGSFWSGLQLVPLNENGFIKEDSAILNIASRQTQPNPIEGGFIFYHENFFYLFASHDFCCRGTASSYHIVVGRSEKISGPYFDQFGVDMKNGGGTTLRDGFSYKRWAGPGHNSVFTDDNGKTFIVYHAYDREDEGKSKLQIEEIQWKEGWPFLK